MPFVVGERGVPLRGGRLARDLLRGNGTSSGLRVVKDKNKTKKDKNSRFAPGKTDCTAVRATYKEGTHGPMVQLAKQSRSIICTTNRPLWGRNHEQEEKEQDLLEGGSEERRRHLVQEHVEEPPQQLLHMPFERVACHRL